MLPTVRAPADRRSAEAGLRFDELSKTFPGTNALEGVSFAAARGQVHALVGCNGSGKSTLIKILAGVLAADPGGRIAVGRRSVAGHKITPEWARAAHVSFIHQELALVDGLSVAENMFAASGYPCRGRRIDWRTMFDEAQRALDRLAIAVDARTLVGELRPVDQTLVAVARGLRGRERFTDGALVLDEPTARLPADEVELILAALRRYADRGQTILYVSHRLDEVLAVGDHVTVLRDGRVVASEPAAQLSERQLAHLIVGREIASMPSRSPRPATEPVVLEVRGVSGGRLRDVSFSVARQEVLGVAGIVGSGRSSLLEMIFGASPRASGSVKLADRALPAGDVCAAMRAGVAYVPEDRSVDAAFSSLGLHENVSAGGLADHRHRVAFSRSSERAEARRAIAQFGIRAPAVSAPLVELSGGNQQKAILARWLLRQPQLLLLDEPTQGVDVGARTDIYRHIAAATDRGMAVLVVSSDLDELLQLSDRIVVLDGGTIAAEALRDDCDRRWLAEQVHGLAERRRTDEQ